jgi:hypothetical protein
MRTLTAVVVLALAVPAVAAPDEDPIQNPRLPRLWRVERRTQATEPQRMAIGTKLGVSLTSLENVELDAGGVRLKVNFAHTPDEKEAETLRAKFQVIHGGDAVYAVRHGADVAEIVCENHEVARKARELLGWDVPGHSVTGAYYFRAKLRVAPLERADGMRWNRLYNLLRAPDDPTKDAAIKEEAKAFVFADRLPAARLDVSKVEHEHGVPRIEFTEEDSLDIFQASRTHEDVSGWTAGTEAWPVDAPEVRAAAKEALGEQPPASPRDRAERVLGWVHAHVRYGGDVVGSRYGVAKVMAQGFGRCWDQSDVFIAVCRAAGVPARQVGGWLLSPLVGDGEPRGEGHVWAEIVVDEKDGVAHVLAIDPGATWLGVSEDYIPLWRSPDGRTPFVYWSEPKIELYVCIK